MESSVFSHFSGFRYHTITFGIPVSHPVFRVQSFVNDLSNIRRLFRLFSLRYNIEEFWYYSVFILFAYIGYD